MYREFNESRAQILVKEDLFTGSVRHSNSSVHSLGGKANVQLIEGPTCFGGDVVGSENRSLSAWGFGLRASTPELRAETLLVVPASRA